MSAETIDIYITPRVQQLCEIHGLWRKGRPKGALAAVLPTKLSWTCPRTGNIYYECDRPQVDALLQVAQSLQRDMWNAGCSQRDSAAAAQWARRIRETIAKAAPHQPTRRPSQTPAAKARSLAPPSPTPGRVLTTQGRPRRPSQGVQGTLFAPPPTGAKAIEAYRLHTMKCLRELVDFSQSTAYSEASPASP